MKNKVIKIVSIVLGVFLLVGCSSNDNKDSLLTKIKEKKQIVVATEGTYPPFSYHNEKGDLVGYDVDIIKEVAKELDVEVKFVETKWDGIIAGLDANKYDLIANQVGITAERKEKYLFSDAYTFSRGVVVTLEDNNDIKSFEDLKAKKSAQTTVSNWADIVRKYGGEVVGTDGFSQSIELVLKKRVDATVNDDIAFYDYKKQHADAKVKIAATGSDVIESGFIFAKANGDDFKVEIDKILKKLSENGTLTKISENYFAKDVSKK